MPGTYQIRQVSENATTGEVTLVVDYTDTAKPGTPRKTYLFSGRPDPAELDNMLRAERVVLFRSVSPASRPLPVAGAAVTIAVDPVIP